MRRAELPSPVEITGLAQGQDGGGLLRAGWRLTKGLETSKIVLGSQNNSFSYDRDSRIIALASYNNETTGRTCYTCTYVLVGIFLKKIH